MKKSDKIALTQKPAQQLDKALLEKKKELFESRARQYLGNLKDTSVFKKIRYQIALINGQKNK